MLISSQSANVTMTRLPELLNVTMTMLPELLNVTMATLPELLNVTLGDCATTTPWVTTSPVNTSTSNTTTACPVVLLPQPEPGGGLGVPFIIQCVIGVCILLANFSILIVLRRCRPAGRTLHYLLQHLAVADLGMAMATFWRVGLIARYGPTVEDVPLRCVPVVALYLVSSGASISFLLLIATDQWYSAAQNASLESRQRWRRWCRWAAVCSWVVWSTIGLLCIPATKAPGTYLRANAPCLMTGTFIQNTYWQLAGLPLIALCVITVTFQWLSLKAARANTQNLMEALKQRHEGFVFGGKVPGSISKVHQKQVKRRRTLISFFSSKVSSRNASNSVVSSYQVNETEVLSLERRSAQVSSNKVCHGKASSCKDNAACQTSNCKVCYNEPSSSKQSTACKVSRKASREESSSILTDSRATIRKMSSNENSHRINGNENETSFNENCSKISIKKVSVTEMNHPEVSGHDTGDFTSCITRKISSKGTMRSSVLGSSYSMNQSGSINRISPFDPTVFPLKGDYYEMKLANTRLQLTRTISLVMAVFVGCWFFYLPFSLILSACGTACHTIHSKIAYVGTIAVGNSLMNAIIYTFRIKQYRAALRELFCGVNKRGDRASAVQPSVNVTTIRELALPPIY